jgi:hypothetical protein
MDAGSLVDILEPVVNWSAVILFPIATALFVRRVARERKASGEWDTRHLLAVGLFAVFTWIMVLEFTGDYNLLPQELVGPGTEGVSLEELTGPEGGGVNLYNISLLTLATLGYVLLLYSLAQIEALRWVEYLMYTPFFVYFWFLTIHITSLIQTGEGYSKAMMLYFYASVFFIFANLLAAGIKRRDNLLLGIFVFFVAAFAAMIWRDTLLARVLHLGYNAFGVALALDKFRPFKEGEGGM